MKVNEKFKDIDGNLVSVTEIGSHRVRFDEDGASETLLIPEFLSRYTPWRDHISTVSIGDSFY